MAQNFDFYDIVRLYALKNNSPYIPIKTLVNFLQRNAHRPGVPPQLKYWAENTQEKIYAELASLSEGQKCILQDDGQNQRIFLPAFFVEKLELMYFNIDKTSDKAFPCEKDLSTSIPAEYVREISVESGIINYLAAPQKTVFPILKLVFQERFGSILTLSTHLPRRIMEIAISKIKLSMQSTRSMDFYRQKLLTHFPGQEVYAKSFFENFTRHQQTCIDDIEKSNDFTFSAWLFLCPLIKTQVTDAIERNGEVSSENIGLYQSVSLLLIFNNYYKVIAINKLDKEKAFASINEKMGLPPYLFNFNEIFNLTGTGGMQILNHYTEDDLMEWLKQKMTMRDDKLPAILKFCGVDGKDNFIRKDKVFALCLYLLKDLQLKTKDEITNRWVKLLRDYLKEKAMENDGHFEDLVIRSARLYVPLLLILLNDKKTVLLQQEILEESPDPSKVEKFFLNGKPIPLRKLLRLKREDLLHEAKLILPFWYSIPFIITLGRILKHGIGKTGVYFKEEKKSVSGYTSTLKNSAEKMSKELVPDDQKLDEYMNSILDRWNQILNRQAREKLTRDVNSTIKDYMRNAIKNFGHRALSASMLEELADRIIMSNQALSKINNRNSLRLYIKLFITKILLNS
jgi:hypothetical protein